MDSESDGVDTPDIKVRRLEEMLESSFTSEECEIHDNLKFFNEISSYYHILCTQIYRLNFSSLYIEYMYYATRILYVTLLIKMGIDFIAIAPLIGFY